MNFNIRFASAVVLIIAMLLMTGCGGAEVPTRGSTIEGDLWHH